MSDVALVVGTRAEIIKMAPVVLEFEKKRIDFSFIFTGQHFNTNMSYKFLGDLGLRDFDYDLQAAAHGMEYAEVIGRIMEKLNGVLNQEKPKLVLAHGDTNSTAASLFTALKKSIPCGHVEAGLRAFDWTMPEETNRILADHCSQLLFAPTELAGINLLEERCSVDRIFVVGNTVVDVCKKYFKLALESRICEALQIENFGVLSVHRKENMTKDKLVNLVEALEKIEDIIVFLQHPYTKRMLNEFGLSKKIKKMKNVIPLEPSNYFDVLKLVWDSDFVLTDSGGLQEECVVLDTPCITLRKNTERPETLTENNQLCEIDVEKLPNIISRSNGRKKLKIPNVFGDGLAGERIATIVESSIDNLGLFKASFINQPYFETRLFKVPKKVKLRDFSRQVPGYITGVYREGKPLFPRDDTLLEKGDLVRFVGE